MFSIGDRVVIQKEIDLYPLHCFSVGLCGTVTRVFPDAKKAWEPRFHVKLDTYFPQLDEWDNELIVYSATSADFEGPFVSGDAFDLLVGS